MKAAMSPTYASPDSSSHPLRSHRLRALVLAASLGCGMAWAQSAAPTLILPDGGQYYGPLKDGLLEGTGRIVWSEVRSYEGQFHQGRMQGQGKMLIPSGVFEGEYRAGDLEGQGSYTAKDGVRYQGQFAHGEFDGQGTLVDSSGNRYEGQFSQGRFTGQGRMTDSSGLVMIGKFDNYLPQGVMETRHPNGSVFIGELENQQPKGRGELRMPDGKVIKTDFSEPMQSDGEINYPNGNRYAGEITMYTAHGKGVLTYANGDVYRGQFVRDWPEGTGVLTPGKANKTAKQSGQWQRGKFIGTGDKTEATADASPQQAERNNQAALYAQNHLLAQQMAALKQGDPKAVEMYALFVAGDGTQEVFRREVEYVAKEFGQRFDTTGRSLLLANSRSSVSRLPLATDTSIERALSALAERMDKQQDLLFVFLTSHGSRQHDFQIGMQGLRLPQLSAQRLGQLLKASGIRKQVVVVSACYSGGFMAPLKSPTTWVLTAARADRTSFGCSDENDFTYFGRALFKESLPQSTSLTQAFDKAKLLVAKWEQEFVDQDEKQSTAPSATVKSTNADSASQEKDAAAEKLRKEQKAQQEQAMHSEPQMSVEPAFQREVDAWFASHPATGKAAAAVKP